VRERAWLLYRIASKTAGRLDDSEVTKTTRKGAVEVRVKCKTHTNEQKLRSLREMSQMYIYSREKRESMAKKRRKQRFRDIDAEKQRES